MTKTDPSELAINGGKPVRSEPFPPRRLFGPEEKAAADEVFDEAIATGNAFGYGGPREQAYEAELATWLGGGMVKTVNSGTSAVLAAVAALELEPGSEIVTPPITDPGGIMPVVMMNCVPVPADANGFSFNMGPEQVTAAITERTRAVIVAHILGEPADVDGICRLARRRGLFVIEDAAQSHAATLNGRMVGTFGDIAAFSTMSGKHHASGAQGGFVFTRDEKLFWKARRFMDRGKPYGCDEKSNVRVGLNLNSNELSAAIGRVQLRKLPEIVRRRRAVAAAVAEGIAGLRSVKPGRLLPGAESSFWFLRLTVDASRLTVDKDAFAAAVAAEGVPVAASYRHIPSEHLWFRRRATYGAGGYPFPGGAPTGEAPSPPLPNTESVVASDFLLCVHEQWTQREVGDAVAALIKVERAFLRA